MEKPKKRRSNIKNPALVKKYNPKVRQEYIDYDYLDKLSESELTWLNKFSEEYINARFTNGSSDIDQTPEGRKAAYNRNNARNRCLYSQLKVRRMNDKLVNYDDFKNVIEDWMDQDRSETNYMENAYIDFLDFKSLEAALTEYNETMSTFTEAHE